MPKPTPAASHNWGTNDELSKFGSDDDPPVAVVEPKLDEPAPKPADVPPPAAPAAKPETPAPAAPSAAEKKKWAVKGKVAGVEKTWEIDEEHFDEKNEKSKWLRDQLQKADDYDRPGGALDHQAGKKAEALAQQMHTAHMVKLGLWSVGADGKVVEDPRVKAYREWQEKQAAAPAPSAAPAPAAETPRQARLAALRAAYNDPKVVVTADMMEEYQGLIADEKLDAREAAKEAARAKEQAAKDAETRRQGEQTAAQTREAEYVKAARTRIKTFVSSLAEKFKDPISGEVDADALEAAEARMDRAAQETQDWAQAEAAARGFAEKYAARLSGIAAKIPKQLHAPTAPPPAPVHRGGTAGGESGEGKGKGKNGQFNPRKSFQDQGADFDAYARSEAGRE